MNKKFIALVISTMLIGSVAPYTMSAFAENTTTAISTEAELDLILPQTMPEYKEFIEKYGNVSVHGKYIIYCDSVNFSTGAKVVTEQEGTAEIKEVKNYSISDGEIKPPGSSADMVYVYEAVSAGTVKFTISQGMPLYWEQSKDVKDSGYYEISENLEIKKIQDNFDWLPQTMPEYKEFIGKYGNVSVHGKYIIYCDSINFSTGAEVVTEQEGTAEIKEVRSYSVSEDIDIDGHASDMVYIYEAVSTGTVKFTISQGMPFNWENSKDIKNIGYYKVSENLEIEKITEKDFTGEGEQDEFDWLPKTKPEYIEFIEKYGNVSVHGKYIIYCDSVNFSTGAEVVTEQTGTAEIKEVKNYSISDGEIKPPGSSADMVYVYEAVSAGTVKFTILQGMPLYWEQSKNIKDSGYYTIADDLTITKTEAEIEKGDANGDGELNIADLVMLNNWLLGNGELTCWQNVDLCKDGKIDVFDMIILKKEIMSKNR